MRLAQGKEMIGFQTLCNFSFNLTNLPRDDIIIIQLVMDGNGALAGGEWMEKQGIRMNKYLSEAGICSRREADRLIDAGKVKVDGETASKGTRVLTGQKVFCCGKPVPVSGQSRTAHRAKPVLLAVYKPKGVVCTTSDKDRAKTIVETVGYPERIYPIGRLDKDSEGLILMTNQGDLVNKIMRSSNGHEKEYLVTVDRTVTEQFLKKMSRGVPILDTVTKPCRVEKAGEKSFRIILTQGLNRQVRRMCEVLGFHVRALKRVRVMNITLGALRPGQYRPVTKEERRQLMESLEHSTNLSYKETHNGRKNP